MCIGIFDWYFDHTGIISTMRQRQQLGKTQDRPSESLKHEWSRTGLINIDRVIITKTIQHLQHRERFVRHREQFVWHRERFVRDGKHRETAPWRILWQKCDGKDKVRFQSLDLVTILSLVTGQASKLTLNFELVNWCFRQSGFEASNHGQSRDQSFGVQEVHTWYFRDCVGWCCCIQGGAKEQCRRSGSGSYWDFHHFYVKHPSLYYTFGNTWSTDVFLQNFGNHWHYQCA